MSQYQLFNQNISFSDSAERFFDMQHRVWNALSGASSDFNKWYDKCGDILTVLKGYEEIAVELIVQYANQPLFNELSSLEIFDISEKAYDNQCLNSSNMFDALDIVADKYNEIIEEQAAEEAYRAERKASRGRVVGGGFGVGGALKGMAAAGAMNAISGAGHGLVNAIGNAGSAIAAASSKKALYDSNFTREVLCQGIKDDILNCFNSHMDLLNERFNSYIVNDYDQDKAGALFENAKKVKDKQQELLVESFKNCPWNEELLKFVFINYKAERKNTWEAAKRFHVDLSKTAEQAFAADYKGKAKTSDAEAQIVKKDILEQMKVLGISSSETVNTIEIDGLNRVLASYEKTADADREAILAAFDAYDAMQVNKRQVVHNKGVWELAQKYSVKFSQEEADEILSRYYTDDDKKTTEGALSVRPEIMSIMKVIGVSYSNTLDQLERDCLERVCQGYQNADEKTCNEIIERINAFEALDKNKKMFLNRMQSRIETIWAKEDDEIFDNVYLNTDIHNRVEVNKAIAFVKEKGRTSSSAKYISALEKCTEENIKKAKTFQAPTTKYIKYAGFAIIILGVILLIAGVGLILSVVVAGLGVIPIVYHSGLQKIYNILTIDGTIKHPMVVSDGKTQSNPSQKS